MRLRSPNLLTLASLFAIPLASLLCQVAPARAADPPPPPPPAPPPPPPMMSAAPVVPTPPSSAAVPETPTPTAPAPAMPAPQPSTPGTAPALQPQPAPAPGSFPPVTSAPSTAPAARGAQAGASGAMPGPSPQAPPPEPAPANHGEGSAAASASVSTETLGAASQDELKRKGLILAGALGLSVCYTSGCSGDNGSVSVGPAATLELGYRPFWFLGFLGSASYGLHGRTFDVGSSSLKGSAKNATLAAGVRFYPFKLAQIDPWAGVQFGYNQYDERATDDSSAANFTTERELRRFVTRYQIGVDFALTKRLTIGPYISFDPQAGGVECTKLASDAAKCTAIHEPTHSDPPGALAPGAQPQFVTFGALLGARL